MPIDIRIKDKNDKKLIKKKKLFSYKSIEWISSIDFIESNSFPKNFTTNSGSGINVKKRYNKTVNPLDKKPMEISRQITVPVLPLFLIISILPIIRSLYSFSLALISRIIPIIKKIENKT